ncbi:unnamed protein product [Choristocarpus tenellus]
MTAVPNFRIEAQLIETRSQIVEAGRTFEDILLSCQEELQESKKRVLDLTRELEESRHCAAAKENAGNLTPAVIKLSSAVYNMNCSSQGIGSAQAKDDEEQASYKEWLSVQRRAIQSSGENGDQVLPTEERFGGDGGDGGVVECSIPHQSTDSGLHFPCRGSTSSVLARVCGDDVKGVSADMVETTTFLNENAVQVDEVSPLSVGEKPLESVKDSEVSGRDWIAKGQDYLYDIQDCEEEASMWVGGEKNCTEARRNTRGPCGTDIATKSLGNNVHQGCHNMKSATNMMEAVKAHLHSHHCHPLPVRPSEKRDAGSNAEGGLLETALTPPATEKISPSVSPMAQAPWPARVSFQQKHEPSVHDNDREKHKGQNECSGDNTSLCTRKGVGKWEEEDGDKEVRLRVDAVRTMGNDGGGLLLASNEEEDREGDRE